MRFVVLPAVLFLVAGLPAAVPTFVQIHEGFIALWMLSAVLVAYAARDEGYVLAFPVVGRILEWIGARSYALYLLHMTICRIEADVRPFWPAYDELIPINGEWDTHWKRSLVRMALAFVAADILHRAVERPMIALGRRLLESKRTGVPISMPRLRTAAIVAAAILPIVFFRHSILVALGPRNLARGTAVYASSEEDNKPPTTALTNGKLEDALGLHTKHEKDPWAMIDLGHETDLGAIRVYNREDGFQAEALPLEVQISDDAENFTTITDRDLQFSQEWPWRIKAAGRRARYVRLRVPRETTLCLSEVEIYAEPWMALIP
jgi:hypothetical protein